MATPTSPIDVAATFRFLRALAKANSRAWFAANRARYDDELKPCFEDFVAGLLIAATKFDERFAYIEPKRCIFRIYRDVRFSSDKSPYKTRLSAFLSPSGWRGSTPGFYCALEPGGQSVLAAGIYVPEKPVLQAIRRRIADGDAALERLLRGKAFAPYLPIETDALVRMPAGFAKDHPRGELIRARRYMVSRTFADAELIDGDAFALYRRVMRETAPFVGWLDRCAASLDRGLEPLDAALE